MKTWYGWVLFYTLGAQALWAQDNDGAWQKIWQQQDYAARAHTVAAEPSAPEKPPEPEPRPQCLPFRLLVLGLEPLAPPVQKFLRRDLQQTCLTETHLSTLRQRLADAFSALGYFRLALKQEVKNGVLVWRVQPSRVQQVENHTGMATANLLGKIVGRPLNLFDLDQAMDQVNRLPGYQLLADIYPVSAEGSKLKISLATQKKSFGAVALDNRGTDNGPRLKVSAGLNNLSGHADYLWGTVASDLRHGLNQGAQNASLYYSLPYGYWTYSAFLGGSHYAQNQQLTYSQARLSGYSSQMGLGVDKVVKRNNHDVFSASARLTRMRSENRFNGERIDVSSNAFTALSAGVNYTHRMPEGYFAANAQLQQGLPIGVRGASFIDPYFHLFSLNLDWDRWYHIQGHSFRLDQNLSAQWSPKTLPSALQMNLNGGGVRGLHEQNLTGDSGAALTQSLYWPQALSKGQWAPYLGLDAGITRAHLGGKSLALSTTIGAKVDYGAFSGQLFWSGAFSRSDEGARKREHLLSVEGKWSF